MAVCITSWVPRYQRAVRRGHAPAAQDRAATVLLDLERTVLDGQERADQIDAQHLDPVVGRALEEGRPPPGTPALA